MNNNLLNNNIFEKILKLNNEVNRLVQKESKNTEKMYLILYKARILHGNLIKWLYKNLNKDNGNSNYYYEISILHDLINETTKIINNIEMNIQYLILNEPNKINNIKITLFYVDWCPYCINFMPLWKKFVKINKDKINCEQIDCTNDKSYKEKYKLSGYPTILLFDNDNNINIFEEESTLYNLNKFIQKFI